MGGEGGEEVRVSANVSVVDNETCVHAYRNTYVHAYIYIYIYIHIYIYIYICVCVYIYMYV